jgi:uncharacterized protein YkwD
VQFARGIVALSALCYVACGESPAADSLPSDLPFSPDLRDEPPPDAGPEDAGVDAGPPVDLTTCESTEDWDPMAVAFEDEVVELTNQARRAGQDCGPEGLFTPTGDVVMEPRLRCAARIHARYMAMAENDFGHESDVGSTPSSRVKGAGYDYGMLGENLGVGPDTPEQIVAAWIASPGHCKVLMQPDFTEVGIGYAFGTWATGTDAGVLEAPYWAQDFGRPRE